VTCVHQIAHKDLILKVDLQYPMLSEKVREIIAARLKLARIKAGYVSAKDFCEKNKLVHDKYRQYEEGQIPLKVSQAKLYCRLLKTSLQELIVGKLK
jgi:hypothetical protein